MTKLIDGNLIFVYISLLISQQKIRVAGSFFLIIKHKIINDLEFDLSIFIDHIHDFMKGKKSKLGTDIEKKYLIVKNGN